MFPLRNIFIWVIVVPFDGILAVAHHLTQKDEYELYRPAYIFVCPCELILYRFFYRTQQEFRLYVWF